MKKRLLLPFLLLTLTAAAQNKTLTLEEVVLKQKNTLAPKKLEQLAWIPGSNQYYYIEKDTADQRLITGEPGKGSKPLLLLSELRTAAGAALSGKTPEMKNFPALRWSSSDAFSFTSGEQVLTYSRSSKTIAVAPAPDLTNADTAAGTGYQAHTKGNNLYILKNGTDIAVTSDADSNIVNGQKVHREEFGISKGTFWSPSGKLLAFYRMDQRMVTDYPIMNFSKQPATVRMIKYPMAGAKSHEVTVGIYDCATGKTVFLKTGEPKDQYLTNICWSPDEKSIYVVVVNREQDRAQLKRYNAASGEFEKQLIDEFDDQYVHPMHPMVFVPGQPELFIWRSERQSPGNRNGRDALYLYTTEGKWLRDITPTREENCPDCADPVTVTDFYGFSADGNTIYLQATKDGTDRHIYATNINTDATKANFRKLTSDEGTHTAVFNSSFTHFIDNYSSTTVPRVQSIIAADGAFRETLLKAENPLKDYKACAVKLFTIKAADNQTPLWCRMFLPPGFNPAQKYPSLVYVYNGPNIQLVTNTWLGGADMFLYYMAQKGFVVFTVDGRGSAHRSLTFEQATFGQLGTVEISDQEKGAEYLKSQTYIDKRRMAVYGWSYGGFMTTSLMTRKPGLFRTGVAGGPVIDWSYYEVMYTERYMNTPQANKEGYDTANLLNYVDKLQGKLLLIHGTSDDVVVWQQSLLYLQKAVEKGIQPDYFVYPGHLHNVLGKDRVHLFQKVSEYIIQNTK